MSELKCGFCKRGAEVEETCGQLHHAVDKPCTAHHKCMQYSALLVQYKDEHFGGFKVSKVLDEIKRGRSSRCVICHTQAKSKKSKHQVKSVTGGTCGCAVKSCRKSFHFYCAKTSNECVTKRLVVSIKRSGNVTNTVLYRVFCSQEHEKQYRQNLKDYSKDMSRNEEESDDEDEDDDDDDDDDTDDYDFKAAFKNESNILNGEVESKADLFPADDTLSTSFISFTNAKDTSTVDADAEDGQSSGMVDNKAGIVQSSTVDNKAGIKVIGKSGDGQSSITVDVKAGDGQSSNMVDVKAGDGQSSNMVDAKAGDSQSNNMVDAKAGDSQSNNMVDANAVDVESSITVNDKAGDSQSSSTVDAKTVESQSLNNLKHKLSESESNNLVTRKRKRNDDDGKTSKTHCTTSNKIPTKDQNGNLVSNEMNSEKTSKFFKNSEFALCVLSTQKRNSKLKKEIYDIIKTDLDMENIIIWQDITTITKMKPDLLPYFMHAISKALKSGSTKVLQNLLFSEKYLLEKCESDYQYQCDFIKDLKDSTVAKNVLQSTWKTISQNLSNCTASFGKVVGTLVPVAESKVLVLYIGNHLDKHGSIRSKLDTIISTRCQKTVYTWTNQTKLLKCSSIFCQNEVDILLRYFQTFKSSIKHVICKPVDKLLLKSSKTESVTSYLISVVKDVLPCQEIHDHVCLILLSELDELVVDVEQYLLKLLQTTISQQNPDYSHYLVLIPFHGFPKHFNLYKSIKTTLGKDVTIKIVSAFNPDEKAISCVMVDIRRVFNAAVRSVAVVDNQKPSTSGTNKKRGIKADLSPSALSLQQLLKHKP